MSTDETYAVFLSHNSEDKDLVEKVAVYLADQAQLQPWLDKWSLIPGEPWVRNLERGIVASTSCAVFVGQSGEGPWQTPEVEAALRRQVSKPEFRVVPVLLPGAPKKPDLPMFLGGNTWVDLRDGLDNDDALWRLECGIRGIPPGRGRPRQAKPVSESEPPATIEVGQVRDVEIVVAQKPARIFISYRHQEPDSALAHAFAEALKSAGHEVFIDTGIRWGADWVKEIREHLDKSDFLLLLLSPDAAKSEMVVEEVSIARELARRRDGVPVILPTRVQLPFSEPLPYCIAPYLREIHQEQWTSSDDTPRLVRLLLETIAGKTGWPEETPAESPSDGVRPRGPAPYFDPRDLITPGGSLETNSRFYILRDADERVFDAVSRPRAVVTVRGPRQTGKTSLIMGVYAAVRQMGADLRAAFVDLQALPDHDLESLDAIWCSIAASVAEQLGLDAWDPTHWRSGVGYDRNFSHFLDRFVFPNAETPPLLICLDEVDRVFDTPIKSQFFSAVRAFFNRGAFDPSWKRVRWLLSTSSEPSFFIEDLTQSPFNIGLRVELGTFTAEEVVSFAGRHGLALDPDDRDKIMDYVGGRPYLVHQLLYHLVSKPKSRDQLFDAQTAGGGIFREHLHRYLMQFQRHEELRTAMQSIIKGDSCDDTKLADRIESAGLARRDDKTNKVVPLCRLYAEFFGTELK